MKYIPYAPLISFIIVATFLQACGDSSNPGSPGDAGTPDTGPAGDGGVDGGTGIHGKIVIHAPKFGSVYLGDGSRFTATANAESNYVVRFEDPAIEGPQTVTWVPQGEVGRDTVTYKTHILAGTNRTDVWIAGATDEPSPPPKFEHLAQVHGKVDGDLTGVVGIDVSSLAPASGTARAQGDEHAYALDAYGLAGTTSATLVAVGTGTPSGYAGTAVRLGMRQGAPLSDTTPVNLTLDTPFDRPFAVNMPSLAGKVGETNVRLRWFGNFNVQTEGNTTGASITLGALPARAPFEQPDLFVSSTYGNAYSTVSMPVSAAVMKADVPFVPPSVVTEPKTIPAHQGGALPDVIINPKAFRVAWSVGDEGAKVMALTVSCHIDRNYFEWSVQADATAKSFTFPTESLCGTADTTLVLATNQVEGAAQHDLGAPPRAATGAVRMTAASYRFHAVQPGTSKR